MKTRQLPIFFSLMLFFLITSCSAKFLPHTNLRDTPLNRKVVGFMELYRNAIESHDVDRVMNLVSPDYTDKAALDEPPYIRNLEDLRKKLALAFEHVKDVSISFYIQHIEKEPDDVYRVIYYYSEHAFSEFPSEEKWLSSSDVNRLIIKKSSNEVGFEILSGI